MMMDPHLLGAIQDQTDRYIASSGHRVLWLQRITKTTPGATATSGRDTVRHQETTFTDGSFGVGWQAMDPRTGVLRLGYFAGVTVRAAVLDNARREVWTEAGISLYDGSLLLYDARDAPAMQIGDLIVLQNDGRRFTVAPNSPGATSATLTPYLTFGTTVAAEVALDQLSPDNVLYGVSVT